MLQKNNILSLTPVVLTSAFCEAAAALHRTSFDFPWTKEAFDSLLSLPTTIGWIDEKALLVCSQVADEMEILTLCVAPDFRRTGLADKFLDYLFRYALEKGIHRLFLEVSVQNTAARNLYDKKGFRSIGYRKNYYKTKSGFRDAVCMEKTF